jgi:hypothetical protein
MDALELPLTLAHHAGRVLATKLRDGSWHVRAEVDGRILGWEHYTTWTQVERFRARMEGWVAQFESTEHRGGATRDHHREQFATG